MLCWGSQAALAARSGRLHHYFTELAFLNIFVVAIIIIWLTLLQTVGNLALISICIAYTHTHTHSVQYGCTLLAQLVGINFFLFFHFFIQIFCSGSKESRGLWPLCCGFQQTSRWLCQYFIQTTWLTKQKQIILDIYLMWQQGLHQGCTLKLKWHFSGSVWKQQTQHTSGL